MVPLLMPPLLGLPMPMLSPVIHQAALPASSASCGHICVPRMMLTMANIHSMVLRAACSPRALRIVVMHPVRLLSCLVHPTACSELRRFIF